MKFASAVSLTTNCDWLPLFPGRYPVPWQFPHDQDGIRESKDFVDDLAGIRSLAGWLCGEIGRGKFQYYVYSGAENAFFNDTGPRYNPQTAKLAGYKPWSFCGASAHSQFLYRKSSVVRIRLQPCRSTAA